MRKNNILFRENKGHMAVRNEFIENILKKIKKEKYYLSSEELNKITASLIEPSSVNDFCLEAINAFYQWDLNNLYDYKNFDIQIDQLLKLITPEILKEEDYYWYVFHTIYLIEYREEDGQKILKILNEKQSKFDKYRLFIEIDKAYIQANYLGEKENTPKKFQELASKLKKEKDLLLKGKLYFKLGAQYYNIRGISSVPALEYFQKAVEIFNELNDSYFGALIGQGYFYIGNIYDDLGKIEKSIETYKSIITIFEKFGYNLAKIYHYIGVQFYKLEQYEEAHRWLVKAKSCFPVHESFYQATNLHYLAFCEWALGHPEKSISIRKELIKKFSDHPLSTDHIYMLAFDYLRINKYEEAIKYFTFLLSKLDKNDEYFTSEYIETNTWLAHAYNKIGQVSRAEEILNEILQKDFKEAEKVGALVELASIKTDQGKLILALRLIKKIFKIYKENHQEDMEGAIFRAKDIRQYIFKHHGYLFALIYIFLKPYSLQNEVST